MSQKILKCFSFEQRFRSRLTFSDPAKIRLSIDDPLHPRLELTRQSYNRVTGAKLYSLDTDLTVTTRVENPDTLKQLIGFDPLPTDADQPTGASVGYKINDGTDDRHWDGGAWAVAGATDWNTALEVVTNIATYPTTSQMFGLVINLVTTDSKVTPTLSVVDVLMLCDIDYFRSIIADALVPSLRSRITPTVDYAALSDGTDILSLRDMETAFNVLSVEAVYDYTADPGKSVSILSSYSATSKNITLTAAVERGSKLWVRFKATAEVYVNWASQDYLEVEKVPAVVIDSVELIGNEIAATQVVKNAATNTASVRRSPFRLRLEFGVRLLAEKNRTLLAMVDKALEHASQTPLLTWPAVDEEITLQTIGEGLFATARPSLNDKHETSYSMVLHDIHLFLKAEESVPLVQQFNVSLSAPALQGGPKYTGTVTGQVALKRAP